MSDVSQGPGWWQASDGKWYRPEQHPNYQPPSLPPPPPNPPPASPSPASAPPPQVLSPTSPVVPLAPAHGAVRKMALTTWEGIWYVVQCIYFGAGYLAKVPAKKAMSDFGLCQMTAAEQFWYVVLCIWFGAGYFAKIPTAKALSELPLIRTG